MALTHLADTSVMTRLAKPAVLAVVAPMVAGRTVARSPMTDLELGFSARSVSEWDDIHRAAAVIPLIEILPEDFTRAAGVQRALTADGLRGRKVPDLLIAAAAERNGLAVLHYDRDFELISKVTGQPHQWVVEPGAVD